MTVQELKTVDKCTTSYLVDVLVSYGEGEGEAQRQFFMLEVVFVQKV